MTSESSLAKLTNAGKLKRQKAALDYLNDLLEAARTTFLAAGEILGAEFEDLIRKIQKFRIKRNDCICEPRGLIGKSEAEGTEGIDSFCIGNPLPAL